MLEQIVQFLAQFKLEGIAEIKMGRGVTSKTSTSFVFLLFAITAITIFGPETSDKIMIISSLLVVYIIYIIGTWIHTSINPHEALDGAQLKGYLTDRNKLGAKDEKIIDTTAVPVPAPEITNRNDKKDGESNE